MADLSDVLSILAETASGALYPNGTTQPSVAGVDCKILQGWPIPADLDADIADGKVQVSVYPMPGMDRNVTRFPKLWQTVTAPNPTLSATVGTNTVTLAGTISTPQTVIIRFNGTWYDYAVQSTDTLDTIATALAALITGASANGAVITTPNAYDLVARVAASGVSGMEIRRQVRVFKLIVWAPTPALRDAVSKAIDNTFAPLEFFTLPDGFAARVIYRGTTESDELQRQTIYRRDLDYSVEYATTQTQIDTTVESIEIDVTDQNDNPITTLNL